MKALEYLVNNPIKNMTLAVTKIVGTNNLDDMYEVMELAAGIGVNNIWFQQFFPTTTDFNNKIIHDDMESVSFLNEIHEYQKKKYPRLNCTFPQPVKRNVTEKSVIACRYIKVLVLNKWCYKSLLCY